MCLICSNYLMKTKMQHEYLQLSEFSLVGIAKKVVKLHLLLEPLFHWQICNVKIFVVFTPKLHNFLRNQKVAKIDIVTVELAIRISMLFDNFRILPTFYMIEN